MIFQLAGGARASRDGRASVRHAQMRMGTTHFLMKTLPRVATEMPCIFWPTRLKSRPAASGSAVWGEPVAAAACSAWPLLAHLCRHQHLPGTEAIRGLAAVIGDPARPSEMT